MTSEALKLIQSHPSKSWARRYMRRNWDALLKIEPHIPWPSSLPFIFDNQPIRKPPQFYRGAKVKA